MDVLQVLNSIGYTNVRDIGKDYQMLPLYRDSDNQTALCVNKTTGMWYDFVTREGGSLPRLVQLTLKLPSIHNAHEYLGGAPEPSTPDEVVELIDIKKFKKELLLKLGKDHAYWIGRGISASTIEIFEGGTTFNGRMAYRYVFPIFDERDDLIGFSGRRINTNEDFPKWKHLGAKSNWLYPLKWNAHYLSASKSVVLVESIGDMLALWEQGVMNTLVTFGVNISVAIVQLLLRMDMHKVVLAFNNDSAKKSRGNEAAIAGYKQLLNFFDSSQLSIAIPEQKDFGVMTPEEIAKWKTNHLLQK